MTSARIVLPWPAQPLWQNRRVHWAVRHSATSKARTAAFYAAKQSGLARQPAGTIPKLTWAFYPPDNRRRDMSNAIAAVKSHQDGIADALGIDDSHFLNHYPVRFSGVVDGGQVVVVVTLEAA